MGTSRRKILLIGVGGFVGLLIAALLIAPSFIDVNSYKPTILAEVKKATGREVAIEGRIGLALLPTPSVSATGVIFFNAPGSTNPHMVELKSVTVKPSLLALLGGEVEVSEVTLVEPKIVLEINAEGRPNWEFAPSVAGAKPVAAKPGSPRPLSLGRLAIENGTLIFSDSKAGLSVVAEKANLVASVGSLDGPYSVAGGAIVNGAPLKLDLSMAAKAATGFAMSLALDAGGGKLDFKGVLSELGPQAKLSGLASVSAASLTAFVTTLVGLSGLPAPALPPLLASKFAFDGGIEVSQNAFAAKDFKLALAGDTGSGSLAVALKPLAVEGKVALPRLDLDHALVALSQPLPAVAGKPASPPPASTRTPDRTSAASAGDSLLGHVTAKLAVEVTEVIYNQMPVRNVALEIDARGGAVAVPKLAATLPGDMALQARSTLSGDPGKPTVSGDFSLVGPRLRDTLKWLAVDVSSVPESKLARLSLKGRMASSGGNVQVSNAVFELDDIKGTGGVIVTFSVPISVVTSLEVDTVDLDSLLVKPAAGAKPAGSPPPTHMSTRAALGGPSFGLKAKVAKLIYNKETIGGLDVDLALQSGRLKLNDIKVSNLGGARLAVRGTVADYSSALRNVDIAFNFDAPDMGRVLKVTGATAPSNLGHVTASGGVSGTVEALTFRELNLAAHGQSARIDGTLTMPGASHGVPSAIGYKGRVTAGGQSLEGTVDAKIADRPHITADLRATLLDLDKLGSARGGGVAAAPARGRQATPAATAPGAIDTSALRSFDASIKLAAATLVMSPMRIGNASFAATLKDGVLTLSHLKGALFGGSIDLSGVVNASQPALSFDLKGDASNISVSEALRSTSGTNQFGGAVKVTIDGRLSASDLAIRGSGTTSAQIRASMAGGARLSGHVFAGADKALTTLGSAATGAAGGVIDNTLGNVLGAVGQRGGVGVGNLLNAISLVLNRFVNHNSPVSGRVDITGGVLTDKGLVVQGNRATANVSTRTNLGASTTDTTVTFFIAEDGSAPYLISTIRGPTSNLSYNVTRGTAKDPPGMVNTLTNTITAPLGGGSSQPQQPSRSPIPNIPLPNIFGR